VVGSVWGTRQAPGLEGYRLLVVRPLRMSGADAGPGSVEDVEPVADGTEHLRPDDGVLVVVDHLGAGPGELVLVAHGSRCRDLTLGESVPTKEVTVAIVDRADVSAGARI